MEVGAGVRRFGSRYINLYLIEEGGRLTLLDAGLPGYWRALLGELEAIGRRLEDIDAVLLTHSHADHRGIAERVRIASGATVYAHALELPAFTDMAEGGMPPFFKQGFRPFIYRFVAHSVRNGVARRVPVAAFRRQASSGKDRRRREANRVAGANPLQHRRRQPAAADFFV